MSGRLYLVGIESVCFWRRQGKAGYYQQREMNVLHFAIGWSVLTEAVTRVYFQLHPATIQSSLKTRTMSSDATATTVTALIAPAAAVH